MTAEATSVLMECREELPSSWSLMLRGLPQLSGCAILVPAGLYPFTTDHKPSEIAVKNRGSRAIALLHHSDAAGIHSGLFTCLNFYHIYLSMSCVSVCLNISAQVHDTTCIEARGQHAGVISLFPPRGSQGPNSGHKA